MGLDEEVYGMHDGDKIGQSDMGGLVRKKQYAYQPLPGGSSADKKGSCARNSLQLKQSSQYTYVFSVASERSTGDSDKDGSEHH